MFDENGEVNDVDLKNLMPETVNWRDISDEDAAIEGKELHEWVSWLVPRYQLPASAVPRCWFRHGPFIEELSALRTSWMLAYITPGRSGQVGVDWHIHLANALVRMRMWNGIVSGPCAGGKNHSDKLMFTDPGWNFSDIDTSGLSDTARTVVTPPTTNTDTAPDDRPPNTAAH
jgi:hypothetical protein